MDIGIDLGTTFSLIAHVDARNTPILFPDLRDANQFRTSSVAAITADGALVGQVVEEMLDENPSLEVIKHFKLSMGDQSSIYRDFRGNDWSPECVSALILKKLLRDACSYSNEAIGHSVIAIPSSFSERQRRATLAASRLAGLKNTSLIEEPIAAGILYGVKNQNIERTILVYDLGGGTFDVSVLRTSPNSLEVLATDGSPNLGGKNIDEAIMKRIADVFCNQTGFDPLLDHVTAHQLRRQAESLKIKLSQPTRSKVETTLLLGGRTVEFVMTRTQFENLIEPIITQSIEVCRRLLDRTGLASEEIAEVIMVGGSTLLPCITEKITKLFPELKVPIRQHLPHMAVAYGAALYAAQVAGESKNVPVVQNAVSRYGVGFRTRNPNTNAICIDVLIPPNSPMPVSTSTSYRMNRADQTRLILEVIQVSPCGASEISLGHLAFHFSHPPKDQPITVTLAYDSQGLISVLALNSKTGERAAQNFLEINSNLDLPTRGQLALLEKTPLIH